MKNKNEKKGTHNPEIREENRGKSLWDDRRETASGEQGQERPSQGVLAKEEAKTRPMNWGKEWERVT